jgi:hypothetical protein
MLLSFCRKHLQCFIDNPQEKLGEAGGDAVPDMNERNDTNGSHHEQKEA